MDTRYCINGAAIREANPNPIIANPVANPLFLGKYFTKVDTGVIYPSPKPIPPIKPKEKYSKAILWT